MKREQEVAIQEPLRAFRATQVAEADRRTADRRAELAQDVQAEVDAFSAAVHAHGDEVGWQRVQLAWMAGFPDPDPKSLRKPTGRYGFREVYLDDAARLRTDIHQKDAAFDQEWGKRLATTEARRLRQLEDFRAGLDQDVERATAREEARLRQAIDVRSVQLPLPTPPQAPPDAQLTARRVDFPAASVSRPAISLPAASDPVALAQARLPVFLAQNRYRLAGPGETGKDATGEFLKWLKQFEVGG